LIAYCFSADRPKQDRVLSGPKQSLVKWPLKTKGRTLTNQIHPLSLKKKTEYKGVSLTGGPGTVRCLLTDSWCR